MPFPQPGFAGAALGRRHAHAGTGAAPPQSGPPAAFKEQLTIPPGTPEETLAFFQKLKERRPNLETEEAGPRHFQRVYETIAAGSSKLLSQKLNADLETQATSAHFEALVILNRLKDERAGRTHARPGREAQGPQGP